MSSFSNILAGIDLTFRGRLSVPQLSPIAQEVSRTATWLAGKTSGRLLFLAALNIAPQDLREPAGGRPKLEDLVRQALAGLVESARAAGVNAHSKFVLGSGAEELLKQVHAGGHDLLLIGTRDLHGLRRILFGSTAVQLIHQCPCPVWVAKPRPEHDVVTRQILVASDLGAAARHALEVGVDLAELTGAPLHVLHVVDYPLDRIWATTHEDKATAAYEERVRRDAEFELRQQLDQAHARDRGVHAEIHLMDLIGLPDEAILRFLHEHTIDLLVLGMAGRTGFEGFLVGNTAERILWEVPCSLLSVRRDHVLTSPAPAKAV
jgi:universal stress protein E